MCRGGGSGREEKRGREGGRSGLPTGAHAGGMRTLLLLQPPPSTQLRRLGLTCSRSPLPGLLLTLQQGPGVESLAVLPIVQALGETHIQTSLSLKFVQKLLQKSNQSWGSACLQCEGQQEKGPSPPDLLGTSLELDRARASPDMS